jgi:hypothetical protein
VRITGFNGKLFSFLDVTAALYDPYQPGSARSQVEAPRLGNDAFVPAVYTGAQILSVIFTAKNNSGNSIEANFQKVLGVLNFDDPTPKLLTATSNAGDNLEAVAHALTRRYETVNQMVVDFAVSSSGWRDVADYTVRPIVGYTADGLITGSNTGQRDLLPVIHVLASGVATLEHTLSHRVAAQVHPRGYVHRCRAAQGPGIHAWTH